MATIAEQVRDILTAREYSAISLYGGEAHHLGHSPQRFTTVRFPGWHPEKERRDGKGRCIYALGRYADNSTLEYRYDEQRGMRLKAAGGGNAQ